MDIVFIEALLDNAAMARVVKAVDDPICVNIIEGGKIEIMFAVNTALGAYP